MALKYAGERGASEVLLANTKNQLCEGGGSNVFLVIDGALVTPPLAAGCLPGITREILLELTEAEERAIEMAELTLATE
jgi:branched-chain amino acid aminotransferase